MRLFEVAMPRYEPPRWKVYAREICRAASIGFMIYWLIKVLEFMAA